MGFDQPWRWTNHIYKRIMGWPTPWKSSSRNFPFSAVKGTK
jgi:hypothetical protein